MRRAFNCANKWSLAIYLEVVSWLLINQPSINQSITLCRCFHAAHLPDILYVMVGLEHNSADRVQLWWQSAKSRARVLFLYGYRMGELIDWLIYWLIYWTFQSGSTFLSYRKYQEGVSNAFVHSTFGDNAYAQHDQPYNSRFYWLIDLLINRLYWSMIVSLNKQYWRSIAVWETAANNDILINLE